MLYPAELQDQVRKIKGFRGFLGDAVQRFLTISLAVISWLLTMAEGSIYGVVRKIDLRPVRLELKCGFRILTQVVDILFLRRKRCGCSAVILRVLS